MPRVVSASANSRTFPGVAGNVNGLGAAARGDCAGVCRIWSERDGSTEGQAICVRERIQEGAFRSGHGVWWVGAGVRSGEFLKVGKADQDVAERHLSEAAGSEFREECAPVGGVGAERVEDFGELSRAVGLAT